MDRHLRQGAGTDLSVPGRRPEAAVTRVDAAAFAIPTTAPESDGTLEWTSTTLVVAWVEAAGTRGLGYTYGHEASAMLIRDMLGPAIAGADALDISASWNAMRRAVRNVGLRGVAAHAISAVDTALWDLKAKLLDLPLASLLGRSRSSVAVYGSGGFTSSSIRELQEQFAGWAEQGISMMKMKVGRNPEDDPARVRAARQAIGPGRALFVDANGAYTRKQALALASRFADEAAVSWFEEPVSSDDLDGLRLLVARAPAGMDVAAGEYGYELIDFRRLLDAQAVDVLQADATRCCGITGLLKVSALCEARSAPLSAHTAPSLHAHPCCAVSTARHVEYFHDHSRIETMLFDGALQPQDGELRPDLSRPGLGLEFRGLEAERFRSG